MTITVRMVARRLFSLEALALLVAATFFSSVIWYLQPMSREHEQSTSVATRSALVDESSTWSQDMRSALPRSYRLMHMRCLYSDPVDNADHERHIRQGRVPVLFIHGNAGSFDLVRSIASLLPLGKWPAMSGKPLDDVPIPALGMTVFTVDLNEDANIHSGAIMIRQAKFVRRALSFVKRRFVSYYVSRGRGVCSSHAIQAAANDFAVQSMQSEERRETTPSTFCGDVWDEVDTVEAQGVWVIGHSMGGIVARLAAILELQSSQLRSKQQHPKKRRGHLIAGIITINTPHRYPPIFIDSEVLRLYRLMHWHWAAATDDNRLAHSCSAMATDLLVEPRSSENAGKHDGSLWCSHDAVLPPVMSLHGGSLDEQVFFETTAMEQGRGMTLFTGHMVDCGHLFNHNAIIWSLEFVEPFVEAVWRMHTRLIRGGKNSTSPKGVLRASLLSVFDQQGMAPPPTLSGETANTKLSVLVHSRPVLLFANGSSSVAPPSHLTLSSRFVVVLVPIRLMGCSSLDAFVAVENHTMPLPIVAAFQSPLLQRVMQQQEDGGEAEVITTWSVLFIDANLAESDGALSPSLVHVHGVCSVDLSAGEVPSQGVGSGLALHGEWFHARRGDAFWFTSSRATRHCIVMPSDVLHDPQQSLQRPTTVDHIAFLKLTQGPEERNMWRAYADGWYVLMCPSMEDVHVTQSLHVPLQWVNWLVVFEGGPLLIYVSACVVTVIIGLEIVGCHHQRAVAVAIGISLLFCTCVACTSSAPVLVPLTCALAGSGVGAAVMRTFGTINGGVHVAIGKLWRHIAVGGSARTIFFARLLGSLMVAAFCLCCMESVFYPLVAWVVAAHMSDGTSRHLLSIAAVLCFHTPGSVFHLKNFCMGSSVAPLAPEHQEASLLLLLAALSCILVDAESKDVQYALKLTIPVALSLMVALLEMSIRTARRVVHEHELTYWDASVAAHCVVWIVICFNINRALCC